MSRPPKIERIEVRELRMPLRGDFATSFARVAHREMLLVAAHAGGLTGWGEAPVAARPHYSPETTVTARHALRDFLAPPALGREVRDVDGWLAATAWVRGHRMARAGLEAALRDLRAKAAGVPLARALGAPPGIERIAVGISLGIPAGSDVAALLAEVERRVSEGYARVKLKIAPGFDRAPLSAVRANFPALALTADGNGAYALADALPLFRDLDALGLLFLEQPLPPDDLVGHARLAEAIETPICLDESLASPADLETALALSACEVVNLKPARSGGIAAALAIHDRCRAAGIPLWCGGMLETGVGRAHNVALAALPGFTLPGDLSASDRYYERDIVVPPFRLGEGGTLALPSGPGIGVEVDAEALAAVTVATDTIAP
jgi:O-succinylbenzoate synthase